MNCSLPGSSVPGDFIGKNTGVGSHALLQGIFPTQGSNLGLPHCRRIFYHLSYPYMPYDTYSSLFDLLHSEWGFLGSSAGKESACSAEYPSSIPGSGSSLAEGIGYPTPVFLGYPGGSGSKESSCNVGDWGLIPGLWRFPGGGHVYPLWYSCLENPHGQRRLVSYSPWSQKESDMIESLSTRPTLYYSFWVHSPHITFF